jgi:hypothetical protein
MGTVKAKGALGADARLQCTAPAVMREALGHDADVLRNRRQLAGLAAQGLVTEAQSLGLANTIYLV